MKTRKCRFKKHQRNEEGNITTDYDWLEGVFHQWGMDYEEFESGPGNFSTAIVELPDGTVENVPAGNVQFGDYHPIYNKCGDSGPKMKIDPFHRKSCCICSQCGRKTEECRMIEEAILKWQKLNPSDDRPELTTNAEK